MFMPDEESKAKNGTENKVAEELPSMKEAVSADSAPVPAQAASSTGPERSNGHRSKRRRLALKIGAGIVALVIVLYFAIPAAIRAFNTISTDDAYVNGHVTFVAARVNGQVTKVMVDDNNAVRKGDLLVELDKKPYELQVGVKQAALARAQADLLAAKAMARGTLALARNKRWRLEHAMEEVHNQVALLDAKVADVDSRQAVLIRAQEDFDRAKRLLPEAAISREAYDQRQEAVSVAEAQVKVALENVYQIRAALGLPAIPAKGESLAHVPPDLDQTFSSVLEVQADLIQSAAQLGIFHSFEETPRQMLNEFMKRAPHGDIDLLFAQLAEEAPDVKQAEAKRQQAESDLEVAKLNLTYCDVLAEIDGVITRRNVNPGNNVEIGQGLMAIRSLKEVWVDANFKETQLSGLRIGQRADLYVDMYGERRVFKGRISGFTMGTGSTLALLPAQNATGNFVKVVQRLPVRIDLIEYDPNKAPLFIGLSVTPYVYYKEPPTGPDAGEILQPYVPPTPAGTTVGSHVEAKP
jgi:membrane fusion protein (multidrug efflux system)